MNCNIFFEISDVDITGVASVHVCSLDCYCPAWGSFGCSMFVEHALCQYYRDSILGTQPLHLEKKVLIASQAMRNDSQLVHKCNHVHDAAIPMVTLNVFAIMPR